MIPTARDIPPTQPSARQDALYPKRGPSNFLYLSLREWPRLPSTARIGRAQFYRARSASKEGTWPLPPLLCVQEGMAWRIPVTSSGREEQIQSDYNDGACDVHSLFPERVIHTVDQDRADDREVDRPDPTIRSTGTFRQGQRGPESRESDQDAENSV